jgi:hypothetical protein
MTASRTTSLFLLFVLFCQWNLASAAPPRYTPLVLMHGTLSIYLFLFILNLLIKIKLCGWGGAYGSGITDTSSRMDHIAALARSLMPGIYVLELEVTGSSEGSVFTGSDTQARPRPNPAASRQACKPRQVRCCQRD